MTQVDPNNSKPVQDPLALFREGYSSELRCYPPPGLGLEAEFFLTSCEGRIASAQTCQDVVRDMRALGRVVSLEFSGIIEHPGQPFYQTREGFPLEGMVHAARSAYMDLSTVAGRYGYRLEDGSHPPGLTERESIANLTQHPRMVTGLDSMTRLAHPDCRLLPLMNASVQVSLSVRDRDELFATAELAYLLTPFIFSAFSNHPPVFNGQDCSKYHPRGKLYEAYGVAGGIAPAFLRASSPAGFERDHVNDIVNTPLFFVAAPDGEISPARSSLPCFSGLTAELRTVSNFRLAESFRYNDVKICNLSEGRDVVGKRVEVRAFDAGRENMEIAPLFCALTMRTPTVIAQVRDLLMDFGFTGAPYNYAGLLVAARQNAVHHQGDYMNVAFGRLANGQPGRMRVFASNLGNILEKAITNESQVVKEAMAPLLERCATGISPAQKRATSGSLMVA